MGSSKLQFLFIGLLLSCLSLFGQRIELPGQVVNTADVEGIHVLNKSTKVNTITNQFGEFTVRVRAGDTLWFSSLRYALKEVIVSAETLDQGRVIVQLKDAINQLDEVVVGNQLSGDLKKDVGNIPVDRPINFYDVGIPGFRGTPKERIEGVVPGIGTSTSVNLEALYKHLSGYYKKLRLRRKWEGENQTVLKVLGIYGQSFFSEAYEVPQEHLYDFLLFCAESTSLGRDLDKKNFASVLTIFNQKSEVYVKRLLENED